MIRNFIGLLVVLMSWVLGAYVGIWQLFIHPIITACQAFDAGTLTGTLIGVTVIKCIFSGSIGIAIA